MKKLRCANVTCLPRITPSWGMIIRFGFYPTRWGRRRRFRCKGCGGTFCRNRGTVYHRLQHRRATFDEVAALSVEGVNKSSIARVQQIAWNTVDRWLERAAASCRRFNHRRITRIKIRELQADEIRTRVGGKEQSPVWVFAAIEVWSRRWPSTVVWKAEFSEHTHLVSRPLRPVEWKQRPADCYRWVPVLSAGRPPSLWGSLPVRPGHQETKK